jgi:hypothetical protein
MKMAVESMKMALRDNSPSRQGAGTKIFDPRNLSSMAAELRNFSWMEAIFFRIFASGAIYTLLGK